MSDQREALFRQYRETHGAFVDADAEVFGERLQFFRHLVGANYLKELPDPGARLLEIGCGPGYLLQALKERGFRRLEGVDLSPANVTLCRERFGLEGVVASDAEAFLASRRGAFDVVVLKDMLEHVEKSRLSDFVALLASGLASGGRLIVQVPNMHWVAGLHERYMDLTHEVGFTRESLGQLMRLHFAQVELRRVQAIFPRTLKQRIAYGWLRPLWLHVFRLHLKLVSEGAEFTWFDCREILAVCREARVTRPAEPSCAHGR
jgi:2-polyprenyl-3-methyl-5-hydroxy-6-metoxy-1,4-benzoquinol methylase